MKNKIKNIFDSKITTKQKALEVFSWLKDRVSETLECDYEFFYNDDILDGYKNKINSLILDLNKSDNFKKYDDIDFIKNIYKIKKFYEIFNNMTVDGMHLDNILHFDGKANILDDFFRRYLHLKVISLKPGISEIKNNKHFEKIKVNGFNEVLHPNESLEKTIGGFLENLYADNNINKVCITLYGVESNFLDNKVFQTIVRLSKKKEVMISLDPKSSGVSKEVYKKFIDNGLRVVVPRTRVHAKFVVGYSEDIKKSKFLISSGNFIRTSVSEGGDKTEDSTIYGKGKYNDNSDYINDLNLLTDYIFNRKKKVDLNKNTSKLLIEPFNGKNKLINYIKMEKEEIFISSTTFYDKDIMDAISYAINNNNVKVNVFVRSDFIHYDKKLHPGINIFKRKNIDSKSIQHGRIFYFKSLDIVLSGSLGCNGAANGPDILYKLTLAKELQDFIFNQINNSELINNYN